MVPMIIMIHNDWISPGIPFLFGALFVSLTDTPGPIHHRRNGMLAAISLNSLLVLLTGVVRDYPTALLTEIIVFSFVLSLLGIYGARAGAVGTLALVNMLIQMSPARHDQPAIWNAVLTASGGLWYAMFSLTLYRLQPYRLVEQALGENLMLVANYIRARAGFYKENVNVTTTYNKVMTEQVAVLKSQTEMRELLFKTRQFVSDASPRSRSIMMIFLESLDLFEETMYSYQDYSSLHKQTSPDVLKRFYSIILLVVAEFEHIGLSIQAGFPVKKMPALQKPLQELEESLKHLVAQSNSTEQDHNVQALRQTLHNITGIVDRLSKIVLYTRMEAHDPNRFPDQELEKPESAQPMRAVLIWENFTFRSNNFRYALRITIALVFGHAISAFFALSHAYWVMLTSLTILKPVYNLTKLRNIQRVSGTLAGVLLGAGILFLISNNTALAVIMILCMLMAYSLLRINYFGFVFFLTAYILITFHFLDPIQFRSLIGERLIDTFIGSLIAVIASRFIFPFWHHDQIEAVMKKTLLANTVYFISAWNMLRNPTSHRKEYNASRNQVIVALTNLSDNFQQMLAEPGPGDQYTHVHQFVIASHTLTSRISSLSPKDVAVSAQTQYWSERIIDILQQATVNLEMNEHPLLPMTHVPEVEALSSLHPLSIIYSLASDIKTITGSMVRK